MRESTRFAAASLTGAPADIARDRAAVLGRIAGILESHLQRLTEIERRFARGTAREREQLAREHVVVRAEAARYRWYLVVQREANGLVDQSYVERQYPLPGPLAAPPPAPR